MDQVGPGATLNDFKSGCRRTRFGHVARHSNNIRNELANCLENPGAIQVVNFYSYACPHNKRYHDDPLGEVDIDYSLNNPVNDTRRWAVDQLLLLWPDHASLNASCSFSYTRR
jgi:hypothetical protein